MRWVERPTDPARRRIHTTTFKVVVHHNPDNGRTTVETEDGPVELDSQTSQAVLREAGCGELADTLDDQDDNSGEPVGDEERDEPTPPELRARILARDGFRCRCCESKKNLTVHHKKWRRYGGRTHPENLLTQCEDCHSVIHDRLLVVRGKVPLGLRFTDSSGRELDDVGEPMGLVLKKRSDNGAARALPANGHTRAAFRAPMRFQDLPSVVDGEWWARHCHLLSFNDRQGTLEFTPGVPLEAVPQRARGEKGARVLFLGTLAPFSPASVAEPG